MTPLAGGPATLSKHPDRLPANAPRYALAGRDAYVLGDNGTWYVDTIAALGPIFLGHTHPDVTRAVQRQVRLLACSSVQQTLEAQVAERLVTMVPHMDQVRFAVNGSDVTNAAVRLARAVTGKRHVLVSGYHGFADFYVATTDRHAGILPDIMWYSHQVAWDDPAALFLAATVAAGDLAAVLVEVPPRPYGEPRTAVTETLLRFAHIAADQSALFILDDVVTGLRYAPGGVQEYYGVQADLVCLSKALGNGYPIAALLGPRDLMRHYDAGDPFMSSTFAGHPIGLAAADATLAVLQDHPEQFEAYVGAATRYLETLCDVGVAQNLPLEIWGNHARISVRWRDAEAASGVALKSFWMGAHAEERVLVGPGVVFPMLCWDAATLAHLQHAAHAVGERLRQALESGQFMSHMPCPVVGEVFRVR